MTDPGISWSWGQVTSNLFLEYLKAVCTTTKATEDTAGDTPQNKCVSVLCFWKQLGFCWSTDVLIFSCWVLLWVSFSCCIRQFVPSFVCQTDGLTFASKIVLYTEVFMVDSLWLQGAQVPNVCECITKLVHICHLCNAKCLCWLMWGFFDRCGAVHYGQISQLWSYLLKDIVPDVL